MSTKASSTKPGFPGRTLGLLAPFYERRWLIKYLVQRQLAGAYRGSYLGLLWAFLSPLIIVALFTLVFSEIVGLKFREVEGDSTLNFGLYLYCGLIPFLAYSGALTQGVNTVRRNSDLIEKVAFPLEVLPLTSVVMALVQSVFGIGALMLVLLVVEQRLELTVLLLPLVLMSQLLFTLGLSYLIAVAGAYVPDIRETLRGMVRLTFFITPILWTADRLPERLRFLVDYNPLAFLVEAYRNLILEGELPSLEGAIYFSVFAVAIFAVGLWTFNRVKHNFADML